MSFDRLSRDVRNRATTACSLVAQFRIEIIWELDCGAFHGYASIPKPNCARQRGRTHYIFRHMAFRPRFATSIFPSARSSSRTRFNVRSLISGHTLASSAFEKTEGIT